MESMTGLPELAIDILEDQDKEVQVKIRSLGRFQGLFNLAK